MDLPSTILVVSDLKVDCANRCVERAGRRIRLTAKEFSLLEYLVRNTGRSLTRSLIARHVWNRAIDGTNLVDVYMYYLRRKIDDGHPRKLIHTVRGVGYVMSEWNEHLLSIEGRS